MTTTTIQKWGNSFAIRIPKKSIEKLKLFQGTKVLIHELKEGNGLQITAATPAVPTLQVLAKRINPQNRHKEIDWGTPQGNEIW